MLTIIGLICWCACGVCSFIYWWTIDFDFELCVDQLTIAFVCGIFGPIAYLACMPAARSGILRGCNAEKIVLVEKRDK